jgi:hypothetical protein
LSHVVDGVAVALLVIGAATWVGGFVTVVVVNRVAARTLPPADRVAFFRAFGRTFGATAGVALVLALVGGGVLMRHHPFDATAIATVVLAVALVAATAIGVAQARAMTRLRGAVLAAAGDATTVARGARNAAALRSLIGVITIALLTFAVLLAT